MAAPVLDLTGKVAIVTGAGRGQGRTHALRLAEQGADVVLVDVPAPTDSVPYPLSDEADLDETAALLERTGRRVRVCRGDVRDGPALTAVFSATVEQWGRVDIVCANAGILSASPIQHMTDQTWQDMIDVNLTGVWRTLRAAASAMIELENGGSIILTSSVAGVKGFGGLAHYTAAKHGVIGLMRAAANELAPHRIRVNVVVPGNADTPMLMNDAVYRLFVPDKAEPTRDDFAAVSRSLMALPAPWIEAEDVSNAVAFLASDEARLITGSTLTVDGGMSQK